MQQKDTRATTATSYTSIVKLGLKMNIRDKQDVCWMNPIYDSVKGKMPQTDDINEIVKAHFATLKNIVTKQ